MTLGKVLLLRNAGAELAQRLELASLGERRGAVGTSRDSAEARKWDEGSLPLFYLSLTASQKLNNEKIKGSSVYKGVFQSREHYFSSSPLLELLMSAVPPTLKILHRKSKKSIF